MKDENIFESVQFINEGATSTLVGLGLELAFMIGVGIYISKMSDRTRIQHELKYALNNNRDLSGLKSKLKKGTRVISADNLSKRVKISDSDKDLIKNNDISILAMVDKQDNIIAYCLVNPVSNNSGYKSRQIYGYNIVDKSAANTEAAKMFIRASFEFKLGIYGDGVKYFYKGRLSQLDYEVGKDLDDNLNKNANYLSKDEANELLNRIEDLVKMLQNKAKSAFKDLKFDSIENKNSYAYIYFYAEDLSEDESQDAYDEYTSKFDKLMKSIGFKADGDYYKSDKDEYKGIKVSFDEYLDDEYYDGHFRTYYYITVGTTRRMPNNK